MKLKNLLISGFILIALIILSSVSFGATGVAVLEQEATNYASSGTSVTCTISSATEGNLIVTAVSTDKDCGEYTAPTGFTIIKNGTSGVSVSGGIAYKISTGGETSIEWTQTDSNDMACWAGEFSGTLSSNVLDVSSNNDSNDDVVDSLSTGTTDTTSQANELAVAIMTIDTYSNAEDGTRSWSNDFSEINYVYETSGGDTGLSVALKNLTEIGTQETTFSTSDTGDEMYTAIVTFKVSSGGDTTAPTDIECNGGSCNISVSSTVDINCSGSTDSDGDVANYHDGAGECG